MKTRGKGTARNRRSLCSGGLLLGLLGLGVTVVGCSGDARSATPLRTQDDAAGSVFADGDAPEVLAKVGDEQITIADVRARIGDDLDKMENLYLQQRSKALETALRELLRDKILSAEARRLGKSVDELIAEEASGGLEPSEVEITTWYQENQDRTGGRNLDQVRSQIADYLRDVRRTSAVDSLQKRFGEERGVVVHFQPFRVEFHNVDAPALGPDDAPVTVVEFSDFQCPFCGRYLPTLRRLQETYGDQIRMVFRQFPLPNLHPDAFKAAEASLCAKEQGRFWEYHDRLFQDQQKLAVRDLKEEAGRLGLDQEDFDACLDSGGYVEQVQGDMREGSRVGINGTPALFVNGLPVEGGAVAYEVIAGVIDQELKRAGR